MKTRTWLLVLAVAVAGCGRGGGSPSQGGGDWVVDAASVGTPDDASAVFYLAKSPGGFVTTPAGQDHALLARELVRQALLISARHELGLVTRDAWLGDAAPDEGSVRPFDLRSSTGSSPGFEVLWGPPGSATAIGGVSVPVKSPIDYRHLLATAETLSRGTFAEILRRVRREGGRRGWSPAASPDPQIEKSLEEMVFFAQFAALRQTHERIASQGESPALLGALVRGYANLGVLTEFHWHPAHKVFKARSMLYAQRWLAREPGVLPRWHRAYALALAGLHADALDDLDAGQREWLSVAEKDRPARPAWVDLIEAYCRYDIDKLAAQTAHKQHGQLAAFLEYHAVEHAGYKRWALQTAGSTLDQLPECYRVFDGVCSFGGVSVLHDATLAPFAVLARTLYARVEKMPGLPEDVRREATGPEGRGSPLDPGEFQARVKLIAALRGASKAPPGGPGPPRADAGEPSWAALGQLIQELSFIHVWQRAYFERYSLGVSADDFLETAAPLVADHPLAVYLETMAWDAVKRRAAASRAVQLKLEGLEPHAEPLRHGLGRSNNRDVYDALYVHSDEVARDLVVILRLFSRQPDGMVEYSRKLLRVSPHSPIARADLADCGEATAEQIAEWDRLAAKTPALCYGLGRHYAKAKRWDDAARCFQAALKIVEDSGLYSALADVYLAQDQEDRWLQTLERALAVADYGLDHAKIQEKIAWHFMHKRQWKRAEPFARGAAQSYSGWGLLCAAACHEGLQEWDDAEQLAKAVAIRYRSSSLDWYYFCRRTGKGDLEAARRHAKAYLEDPSAQDNQDVRFAVVVYGLLEKQLDKTLAIYRESFKDEADPYYGLWVALLADELRDVKTRDAALERIKFSGPGTIRRDVGRVRTELIQLAAWIADDLARGGGKLDLPAADKLAAAIADNFERAYFHMFLARYLQAHGKRGDAIRYWKEVIAWTNMNHFTRTLAGAALLDLGIGPEGYKALLEKAPKTEARPAADGAKGKSGADSRKT